MSPIFPNFLPNIVKSDTETLTDGELMILHRFIARVNARANQDMLNGGCKGSAHHRAMTLELMDLERKRKCAETNS